MDVKKIKVTVLAGLLASAGAMAQDMASPPNSLVVDTTGNVGVGTAVPTTSMHLVRTDGTAQILVEETGPVAPRDLFVISNPGNTKFTVTNSDASESWSFANPGTGFRLSRQGSGVVELEIKNNGNAVLAGNLTQNSDVNAKQDIEVLDSRSVLSKVMALPITEWSYKDDPQSRHIGPMAQDFYKAFQLGHTEKGISTIDTGGVALAAIQALMQEIQKRDEQIDQMQKSLEALEGAVQRELTDKPLDLDESALVQE